MYISADKIALNGLPAEIQTEIQTADQLLYNQFHGWQDILGIKNNKFIFCIAGGFKILTGQFEATSYGSDTWQWCWAKGLWKS